MKANIERGLFLLVLIVLGVLVVDASRTYASLLQSQSYTPQRLFEVMASDEKIQLVDTRPLELEDEDDDVGGYEYSHIPGSIPFPGCDVEKAPPAALKAIVRQQPTVVISRDGSEEEFRRCTEYLKSSRNLEGGMAGWIDSDFPEDDGEYIPQKSAAGAGGGCL